jgi:hypothetical protein
MIIEKAEQAQFNAVSVVRLRYCNMQCILQSIVVAFVALLNDVGLGAFL